jgi:hypothetical protein
LIVECGKGWLLGMVKYIGIICFLLLFWQSSAGQQADKRNSIRYMSGALHAGQLQIHSSKIEHFRGVMPVGFGLDFSWKFTSSGAYELCRCYPLLGVSLNYWDFGHDALGSAVSALFYVEPVLFSPWGADLSLKTGLGVSYMDNPHDEETNPENIVYSTPVAFPLMAGLSLDYPVADRWAVRLSAMFQHISNGGVNQPNLGINYTTLGFGVSYKIDDERIPFHPELDSFDVSVGERGFRYRFIAGLKEPEGIEDKASVLGLMAEYHDQFARINGWSAGVMGELDTSRPGSLSLKKGRLSAVAGHHFILGRFDFGQTAGVYLLRGHSTHSPWFQYYTLDYGLSDLMEVGVGLKAHGKVAEYLGVRLSFSF